MTRHTTLATLAVLPLLGVGLALPGAASAVGYGPVAGVSAPPAPPTSPAAPASPPAIDRKIPSVVAATPTRTPVAAKTPAAATPVAAVPAAAPPTGQLPFTGIDLGVFTVAGGLLLGAGLLLRRTARDRGASS
jgi:hypothetical protein